MKVAPPTDTSKVDFSNEHVGPNQPPRDFVRTATRAKGVARQIELVGEGLAPFAGPRPTRYEVTWYQGHSPVVLTPDTVTFQGLVQEIERSARERQRYGPNGKLLEQGLIHGRNAGSSRKETAARTVSWLFLDVDECEQSIDPLLLLLRRAKIAYVKSSSRSRKRGSYHLRIPLVTPFGFEDMPIATYRGLWKLLYHHLAEVFSWLTWERPPQHYGEKGQARWDWKVHQRNHLSFLPQLPADGAPLPPFELDVYAGPRALDLEKLLGFAGLGKRERFRYFEAQQVKKSKRQARDEKTIVRVLSGQQSLETIEDPKLWLAMASGRALSHESWGFKVLCPNHEQHRDNRMPAAIFNSGRFKCVRSSCRHVEWEDFVRACPADKQAEYRQRMLARLRAKQGIALRPPRAVPAVPAVPLPEPVPALVPFDPQPELGLPYRPAPPPPPPPPSLAELVARPERFLSVRTVAHELRDAMFSVLFDRGYKALVNAWLKAELIDAVDALELLQVSIPSESQRIEHVTDVVDKLQDDDHRLVSGKTRAQQDLPRLFLARVTLMLCRALKREDAFEQAIRMVSTGRMRGERAEWTASKSALIPRSEDMESRAERNLAVVTACGCTHQTASHPQHGRNFQQTTNVCGSRLCGSCGVSYALAEVQEAQNLAPYRPEKRYLWLTYRTTMTRVGQASLAKALRQNLARDTTFTQGVRTFTEVRPNGELWIHLMAETIRTSGPNVEGFDLVENTHVTGEEALERIFMCRISYMCYFQDQVDARDWDALCKFAHATYTVPFTRENRNQPIAWPKVARVEEIVKESARRYREEQGEREPWNPAEHPKGTCYELYHTKSSERLAYRYGQPFSPAEIATQVHVHRTRITASIKAQEDHARAEQEAWDRALDVG